MTDLLKGGHLEAGRKEYFHSMSEACPLNPVMKAKMVPLDVDNPEKALPRILDVDHTL
jgi:hypothetical protein